MNAETEHTARQINPDLLREYLVERLGQAVSQGDSDLVEEMGDDLIRLAGVIGTINELGDKYGVPASVAIEVLSQATVQEPSPAEEAEIQPPMQRRVGTHPSPEKAPSKKGPPKSETKPQASAIQIINTEEGIVRYEDRYIKMNERQFKLFKVLSDHPKRWFTAKQLEDHCNISPNLRRVAVHLLRKKLGKNSIGYVWDKGYIFRLPTNPQETTILSTLHSVQDLTKELDVSDNFICKHLNSSVMEEGKHYIILEYIGVVGKGTLRITDSGVERLAAIIKIRRSGGYRLDKRSLIKLLDRRKEDKQATIPVSEKPRILKIIDPEQGIVEIDGSEVQFSGLQFKVFRELVQRAGKSLSTEEIRKLGTGAPRACIRRIRTKVGRKNLITTRKGKYVWEGPAFSETNEKVD